MNDVTIGNPQGTVNVTEAEIGWAAGIVDGEGTVVLFLGGRKNGKLNNVSPQVIVGNTDIDLIERYVDILKRGGVGAYVSSREPKNITGVINSKPATRKYKKLYVVSVVGFLRVKSLLSLIGSNLTGEKKKRADVMIRFIDQRLAKAVQRGTKFGRAARFDLDDLLLIKEFCKFMKSKYEPLVDGLLRDYEQSRSKAA